MANPTDRAVAEALKDIAFVVTIYTDWTALQLPNGDAFGFNRATGAVYKLPHSDCPLIVADFRPARAPERREGAEEDAARWRWFRENGESLRDAGVYVDWCCAPEELDAAIDRARGARGEE